MSENNAPHLPDDVYPAMRMRWLFVLVLVVSILGGVAGGTYAMRFFLPALLTDLIETLPLSNQVRRVVDDTAVSPFADMVRVTYSLADASGRVVGSAVSFTSDGWMVSEASAVKRANAVRVGGTLYKFDRSSVVYDSASTIAFLKIEIQDASSPSVVDDARFDAGDRLFVVGETYGVFESRVSVPYGALPSVREVYDTDVYHRVVVLDRRLPDALLGAPVFDVRGSVAGILSSHVSIPDQSIVIPVHHFTSSFKEAVTTGKVIHPYTGLRFALSDTSGVDLSMLTPGVSVEGSARFGVAAVRFGSPAWNAGLRGGDRVMRIEDRVVGTTLSLPEVLLQYNPGQEVHVIYERDGQEFETQLTLGTRK